MTNNQFIWITDTYRVNVQAIFSLQQTKEQNAAYKVWMQKYNEFINDATPEHYPELDIGDGYVWSPLSGIPESDSRVEQYSIKYQEFIEETLGKRPPEFITQYTIIMNTGVKMSISKSKYDLINEIIDELQTTNGED